LMPSLNFTLGLRMEWRTANIIDSLILEYSKMMASLSFARVKPSLVCFLIYFLPMQKMIRPKGLMP
jgi:hypothetical protein